MYGVLPNLDCVQYYGSDWAGFRYHAEHLYYLGKKQVELYLTQSGFRPRETWSFGEPWEPSIGDPFAENRPGVAGHSIRKTLRAVPGLLPAVRAARSALSGMNKGFRARRARYRAGLGHDLYFLAEKT